MMTRIVALDTAPLLFGELDMRPAFSALGELTTYPDTPASAVLDRVRGAEYALTNKVRLDASTLGQLADSGLRYIGVLATGYNVVDIDAARRLGIAVTNVRGYASHSVAQHVWAMVLNATNAIALHAQDVAAGGWTQGECWCRQRTSIMGLQGKTLGILGFGGIGQQVAQIGAAFGMRLLVGEVPGRSYTGGDRADLMTLLEQSDVLSLHCPLTEQTTGMVNDDFLRVMKSNAILVNAGRGGLVDENALARTISRAAIGHVGLDVLSVEPPPADHPLVQLAKRLPERLTITGHYAWSTSEARTLLIAEAAQNIRSYLAGEVRNRIV